MNLHVGEKFSESEYGLHTSYGDFEYLYDYFGDGEFGVLTRKPIDETQKIIEELKNEEIRSPEDVSKDCNVWKTNRRRFKKIDSFDGTERDSLSNDGLDSGLLGNNQNNKPQGNDQESITTFPTDEYYKTGADGTNRPRYERRYSLRNPNSSKKTNQELWHEQQAEFAKKIEQKRQRDMADNSKGVRARAADYLDRKEYQFADRGFYLKQWQTEIEESLADDPNLADIFENGRLKEKYDAKMLLDTVHGRIQTKRDVLQWSDFSGV